MSQYLLAIKLDTLNILACTFGAAAVILGYLIVKADKREQNESVVKLAQIQLAVLLILCLITFISAYKNGQQTDNIEDLAKQNKELGQKTEILGRQIRQLSELNNSISRNIQRATEIDTSIDRVNLALTEKVQKLTAAANSIVSNIDNNINNEFSVSGEFNFTIGSSISNMEVVRVYKGMFDVNYNVPEIRSRDFDHIFMGAKNLRIYVRNMKFFVDADVRDLFGNQIAVIEKNKWRVNKNSCSRFNFDSTGFELFDNAGRVALSIDFRKPALYIQGYVLDDKKVTLLINSPGKPFPYYGPLECGDFSKNSFIDSIYSAYPIKPLFKYLDKKWRRIRL